MRLLPRAWPDVHVSVRVVLALPTERPLLKGQRLGDEIDRFPVALNIRHRVGIIGRHLTRARLHEADIQTSTGNDIRRGVFLCDSDRVWPQRDQGPHTENADLTYLAGQDTQDQRVGSKQGINSSVMLDGDNIDSPLVAQHELVKGFLEQVGSDLWVTILIRQAGPDGIRAIEHVWWDEGIRVLVVIPDFHGVVLSLLFAQLSCAKKAATRSTKASGCSISG